MPKMRFLFPTDKCGILHGEWCLVRSGVPIFFITRNRNCKKFLTVTLDWIEWKWVIAPTTNSGILRILNNETPMEEVFRQAEKIYVSEFNGDYDNHKLRLTEHDPKTFPEEKLPNKGEFFELNSSRIQIYREKLRHQIDKNLGT